MTQMSKKPTLAVVGATGEVGTVMLGILSQRDRRTAAVLYRLPPDPVRELVSAEGR